MGNEAGMLQKREGLVKCDVPADAFGTGRKAAADRVPPLQAISVPEHPQKPPEEVNLGRH